VLLERKFADSAEKFTGNLNEAIDKCFELAGLGDLLAEKGKELRTALGDKVQEGRKEMQDKIEQTLERGKNARLLFLYKLLGRVWSAAESSYDFLDNKLAKAEKGSEDSEITKLAKKIREHPYKQTADAIFHPGETADAKIKEYSKALESYTQESVHKMVDGMARGNHKEFVNQLLALGCGRITQGKAFWSNPENVMEPARERFAEYSQSHQKPVEEEYASTMLYLNVKQVIQPIAGAVEIYVNGKEKLVAMATAASDAIAKLDWDALKSSINLSADKVDAAFDIFDKALVGWQAQPYLQDCRECEWVMADLTDLISLPRK
jgi:flagellar biosynthesis chaperone FliJ